MSEALTGEIESLRNIKLFTHSVSEQLDRRLQCGYLCSLCSLSAKSSSWLWSKNNHAPSNAGSAHSMETKCSGHIALSHLPAASKSRKLTGVIHLLTRLLSLGSNLVLAIVNLKFVKERRKVRKKGKKARLSLTEDSLTSRVDVTSLAIQHTLFY